ncbi:MAG: PilZ domain-containing protein [bacterium]
MVNQRRHVRVPLNSKVIVLDKEISRVNTIRDISSSGVFVETIHLPKIGTELYLLFPLHSNDKTAQTYAKVVRIVEPGLDDESFIYPGIGLEFIDVPFESSVLIEDYIVHVKYTYEELMLIINMKEPDMKRIGQLLKKVNVGQYKDFFELKDKIRKTCYALGILKENGE